MVSRHRVTTICQICPSDIKSNMFPIDLFNLLMMRVDRLIEENMTDLNTLEVGNPEVG